MWTPAPEYSRSPRSLLRRTICSFVVAAMTPYVSANVYIRDDLADSGIEPNPNPNNAPIYLSPDIWVRNMPMPGWNPYPFSSASPPAWVDTTHFDPDYASPASGHPNYVYVRVRNINGPSTGTERLLLYAARASTGLTWDPAKIGGSFIDNVLNGAVLGMEITKIRKNAATASQAERDAFKAAMLKVATDPALRYPPSNVSYWHTQQEIHRWGPMYRHGFNGGNAWVPSVAFLPWHREFINRFEGLLQEADPTVKLLYWQWTDAPTGANAPFDYASNFMGSFGTGNPPAAVPMGPPLSPDMDAAYDKFGVPGNTTVTRRLGASPLAQADATNINRVPYDAVNANTAFSGGLESFSHNNSHVYIASMPTPPNNPLSAGDQLFQPYAARDPFFFLLHAKVDELWARWQRKTLANLDPATTFAPATANATITASMGPWDGTIFLGDTLPNQTTGIDPWTAAGGQIYSKAANDRSVTSPPFYDTSPLTIPAMQAGQEAIIEIPWYPPNPQIGPTTDGHVCLIARIETSTTPPYGMTVPETTNIAFNTIQNNKIAWRNVNVVDTIPGPFKRVNFLTANGLREPVITGLKFGVNVDRSSKGYFKRGTVRVDLGEVLYARWVAGGRKATRAEPLGGTQFRISTLDAALDGMEIKSGEVFPVQVFFDLRKGYSPTKPGERIVYDVMQAGTPNDGKAVVGGVRYELVLDKLTPLERGGIWRWVANAPPPNWTSPDFDDSTWFQRKLALGWVEPPVEERGTSFPGATPSTYYFRRVFTLDDPSFYRSLQLDIKRSDGAVAYLNGVEVYRLDAKAPVAGLARKAYFPVQLNPGLLHAGPNVLAVEIHRAQASLAQLTFDAGLVANANAAKPAPLVEFATLIDGTPLTTGRQATIRASALKVGGAVEAATLFVDESPVETLNSPPFDFGLTVQPGPHRLRVAVTDDQGQQASTYATVNGVDNVPPRVRMIKPAQGTEVELGTPVVAVASAVDSDGTIARVDFYVHQSYIIGDPGRQVGTSTQAPYSVTITDLQPGHAMITAVAYDSGGERTAAAPVMVMVMNPGEAHDHSRH